jgi:hypothetical protein
MSQEHYPKEDSGLGQPSYDSRNPRVLRVLVQSQALQMCQCQGRVSLVFYSAMF